MDVTYRELKEQVQGAHAMLSTLTGTPLFVLSDDEAASMAKAILNVQKHYPAIKFDGKGMALFGLISTAGFIYMPRLAVLATMRKPKKSPVQPASPDGITPVPPGGIDFTGEHLRPDKLRTN